MSSKQTAVQQLVKMFKENIYFLESSLLEQPYAETRITIKARISQARYSLRCAEKMLETEKEQIINSHIEIMKQGLIEEGERKWEKGFLPKIKKLAEQYYKENYEQK